MMPMTRRRWLCLSASLVSVAALSLIHPAVHWRLIGWARGEAFYQGRPTSYWRKEAHQWVTPQLKNLFTWSRRSSWWEERLANVVGMNFNLDQAIPWILGDAQAVPMLLELLADEDPHVCAVAISGLAKAGPDA